MHLSALTLRSRKKAQTERKAQRTDFCFHGSRICRETFKFIHNISQDKLTNLIKHYKEKVFSHECIRIQNADLPMHWSWRRLGEWWTSSWTMPRQIALFCLVVPLGTGELISNSYPLAVASEKCITNTVLPLKMLGCVRSPFLHFDTCGQS